MYEKHARCRACDRTYPLTKKAFTCPTCKGTLEVIFDYTKLKKRIFSKTTKTTKGVNGTVFAARPFNHARYAELYPVKQLSSLGEGGTPLLRSRNIEKKFKLRFELYFKYEAQNPTGSFKDRGSSVEVSKAVESKSRRVICASTGNMGASVSAYASIHNLECFIFTPQDARPIKLEQILAYGAHLFQVDGNFTHAERLVEDAYKKYRLFLLGDYLYRREGTKSVGFEIAEQLPDVNYVVVPLGNGTLMSATWKGLNEFKKLGLLTHLPKMVGIQAEGCNPLVRAFKRKSGIKALANPHTIATAMECGAPLDGEYALAAMRESKGFAEDVTDGELLAVRNMLAVEEGLFVEPAGAAAVAGVLNRRDEIQKKSKVVCVLSGHGLKTPFTGIAAKLFRIGPERAILKLIFSK